MIGHNRPDPVRAVREETYELINHFQARRADILTASEKITEIKDRFKAGDAIDIIGIANKVWKRIEERRLEITRPYDDAVQSAIATMRNFWEPVEDAVARLKDLADRFQADGDARVAQQKAEQAAEEARLRAAAQQPRQVINYANPERPKVEQPAPAPVRQARIRGDRGHQLIKRGKIEITVDNVRKVPLEILNSKRVQDAIIAVARDLAKHREAIPGLKIDRSGTTTNVQ